MSILIKNAAELITCKNGQWDVIENGAVYTENSKIKAIGTSEDLETFSADTVIDAAGKVVMPGFVDPHTHTAFYGTREREFAMRIAGKSYLEILESGGGIKNSVRMTRAASSEDIYNSSMNYLDDMMAHGTTTVEIKSGYALNLEDELKQLDVIQQLDKDHPMDCVATFLGPHSTPLKEEFDNNRDFLDHMIQNVLPVIKEKDLAEFCDIFCEKGVFSVEEAEYYLSACKDMGFKLKIHADEIHPLGGSELAGKMAMTSADHLLRASEKGMKLMAENNVCAVTLPATLFFLMSEEYADAVKMKDMGCTVALATDFNPGSSYIRSMQIVISLACMKMKMSVADAIIAATYNSAKAVDRQDVVGSLEVGKKADIIILNAGNHMMVPYSFGSNLVNMTIKNGEIVYVKQSGLMY